jgi:RNA polymerase sigma-70 factor (ECF subfamily)
MDASITFRLLGVPLSEQEEQQEQEKHPSTAAAVSTQKIETDISDEALVAEICEGSREAMAVLFRRHARTMRGVAYRILRDAAEADDLVQDIFILVHRLCTEFDSSRGSARFWILQMTHHRAISRWRYLKSRHFYSRVDLNETSEQSGEERPSFGPSSHPSSIEEALNKKETLQSWFEQLSPNQRETFRLFFFEGYTFEEIAAKLGQTTSNARNHYYRGLERLRKQIFAGKLPGLGAL